MNLKTKFCINETYREIDELIHKKENIKNIQH
jgi:hypothetical protein